MASDASDRFPSEPDRPFPFMGDTKYEFNRGATKIKLKYHVGCDAEESGLGRY